MSLDCFIATREIIVDAAGWSDLLLGVVIGAIKPPDPMLMERRIPTSAFQPPNFANKKYLDEAAKIADQIIEVMQPDEKTCFKVCSEYVLSSVVVHLQKKGFNVQVVRNTGELKDMVERGYVRWCIEAGVPQEILKEKRRFWTFLGWVAEMPHLRESIVKTGWASWEHRWRKEIYGKNSSNDSNSELGKF